MPSFPENHDLELAVLPQPSPADHMVQYMENTRQTNGESAAAIFDSAETYFLWVCIPEQNFKRLVNEQKLVPSASFPSAPDSRPSLNNSSLLLYT